MYFRVSVRKQSFIVSPEKEHDPFRLKRGGAGVVIVDRGDLGGGGRVDLGYDMILQRLRGKGKKNLLNAKTLRQL